MSMIFVVLYPWLSRFIVTTHFAVRLVLRFWTPYPLRAHLVRVSVALSPEDPSVHVNSFNECLYIWDHESIQDHLIAGFN